jgi:putative ABC transport system substrate-binding protein
MYIQTTPPFPAFVSEISALFLKYRIPAVSELRELARSGAFLSYGPNLIESTRRQAYFVDCILKGAGPADLKWDRRRVGVGRHLAPPSLSRPALQTYPVRG